MKEIGPLLKKLGFSEKETAVYRAALGAGPAPVRKIAELAGVNRGTTYDVLKDLMKQGLVAFYHKEKKQYFVAEDPAKLLAAIDVRAAALGEAKREIQSALPELRSAYAKAGEKPVVRYYEGAAGVRHILEDVLGTGRDYVVYSSADIRERLYAVMPDFTTRRVKAGIRVKVIALGSGGEATELSERRWLTKETKGSPTYTLIYGGKVALISVHDDEPRGVILEDAAAALTQATIFNALWKTLV